MYLIQCQQSDCKRSLSIQAAAPQHGKIEEGARYCESDVLNTYRVWLVYQLFRGSISVKELDWSVGSVGGQAS
jgi:hypothetical protein